jgi:hypothetical protein
VSLPGGPALTGQVPTRALSLPSRHPPCHASIGRLHSPPCRLGSDRGRRGNNWAAPAPKNNWGTAAGLEISRRRPPNRYGGPLRTPSGDALIDQTQRLRPHTGIDDKAYVANRQRNDLVPQVQHLAELYTYGER